MFELYHVSRQSFLYLREFYVGELHPDDVADVPLPNKLPPGGDGGASGPPVVELQVVVGSAEPPQGFQVVETSLVPAPAAAQDRSQQRKQLLDLAAEHAKLLSRLSQLRASLDVVESEISGPEMADVSGRSGVSTVSTKLFRRQSWRRDGSSTNISGLTRSIGSGTRP